MQLRLASIALLQQLGEQFRVLHFKGEQHPLGRQPPAEVELLQQAGNRFCFFVRPWEYLVVLVQQVSTGEMQHREAGLRLCLSIANHVGIRQGSGGDQLLLPQIFHSIQPIPQAGGKLKFQIIRSGEHLLSDLLGDRFVIPLQ